MRRALDIVLAILALGSLSLAGVLGLKVAPSDRDMGDLVRIMFVHVPAAWAAMLAYTVTLVASLIYLWRSSWVADALAESSAEVGVLFNGLLLISGAIWGRPTWGVWWTWDPRLTTAAIMMAAFSGYLALRRFADSPEKRAAWSAVAAIVAYMDLPLVWFSVRWWNTLHQVQNTPQSFSDPSMRAALYVSALAFLLTYGFLLRQRFALALKRQAFELLGPDAPSPNQA